MGPRTCVRLSAYVCPAPIAPMGVTSRGGWSVGMGIPSARLTPSVGLVVAGAGPPTSLEATTTPSAGRGGSDLEGRLVGRRVEVDG